MPQKRTYFSPKTEKRGSAIEGRGLFAAEAIDAGEIVVVKGGHVMITTERDKVGERLGPAEIQIGDGLFIGPVAEAERESGMMHLNHSCDPNLGIQGQIVHVAMRDIAAVEELTFDYAMNDNEEYEAMVCNCGTPRCRGVVSGKDWMKPELQRRYRGYFSFFIERKIDAAEENQS
tara:strand:- start:1069 stop:1593 length:525 start_codon:yes stop_codon:yes gene_type:complete